MLDARSPTPRRPSWRVLRLAAALLSAGLWLPACEPLLLTPPQYGTVRVTVATSAGAPVFDVSVILYTGVRPIEYSSTDPDGSHTFERVPPGNYGVAGVMPPGMCNMQGSQTLVADNLEMSPGQEQVVAFTIRPCA